MHEVFGRWGSSRRDRHCCCGVVGRWIRLRRVHGLKECGGLSMEGSYAVWAAYTAPISQDYRRRMADRDSGKTILNHSSSRFLYY